MRIFVVLFFVFHLTACMSLSIPKQTKLPMTSGHKVLGVSVVGSANSPIGFNPPGMDGRDALPPESLENSSLEKQLSPYGFSFAYGLTDKIDIETELVNSDLPDFYVNLGLKYQWLGESAFKSKLKEWTSATQLKFIYGRGDEAGRDKVFSSTEDDVIKRHLLVKGSLTGLSLSNSFGYMLKDWFLVYGGGELIYLYADYEVKISTTKAKNTEKKKTDDNLWIYGPFVGIQLNTTDPRWRLVFALEGSFMNFPFATGWNKRKKRHWHQGLASSIKVLFPL